MLKTDQNEVHLYTEVVVVILVVVSSQDNLFLFLVFSTVQVCEEFSWTGAHHVTEFTIDLFGYIRSWKRANKYVQIQTHYATNFEAFLCNILSLSLTLACLSVVTPLTAMPLCSG